MSVADVADEEAVNGVDGQPLTARGQRTRRRLLDAAEAVFADLGWYDASITKITDAAGVAQGTFYRYFPSKQAIFSELLDDLNRRVRHAMAAEADGSTDRLAVERAGFAGFFRFTAEHPALYRIVRQAEFVAPEALRRHYEKIAEPYAEGLAAAAAAGEVTIDDPTTAAWALMAIGELIGARFLLWEERDAVPDDVFEAVLRLVGRALGRAEDELVGDASAGGAPAGSETA